MNNSARSRIPSSAWKMGVFAVVALLLLGVMATLVGNIRFTDSRVYHADFTDAAGVVEGNRVRLSGVEVGRVVGTSLVGRGDGQVARVTFEIFDDVPVYESAELLLRYENVIGQRYLEIQEEPGAGDAMPEGAVFPLDQTTPALNLTTLFNGFQPLFQALDPAQVNRLSRQLVEVLQGQGGTYASLMRTTASVTNTLADRDRVIGRVVQNLGGVLETVGTRDRELTRLITTFAELMAGLSGDRKAISASLPGLSRLLTVSAGAVGDIREPLAGDIRQLDRVAGLLGDDALATSLERMPQRLRTRARTGSYGSYFNFYVCGMSLNLRLLGDEYLLESPSLSANERDTVCGRGSD